MPDTLTHRLLMSSKSPFDRLSDEIDGLTPKVDGALATYLKAFEEGKDKDFVAALKAASDGLKAQLDGLLADRSRELSLHAATVPPTQGKPTPRPRLRHCSIFARSPLAPCSFYLAPPVSLPPCSVLSNLLCASGRRVCARTRLRGWESEIAGLARELSLWPVVRLVSVCL